MRDEAQNQAMKNIFDWCWGRLIDPGEVQIITARQFGKPLHEMSIDDLETVKTWWVNNWWRTYQLLEPEKHDTIMAMDSNDALEYQRTYNSEAKKHILTMEKG